MFGDAMRDILDPGLKGGVGRLGAYGAKSVGKAKKKMEACAGNRKAKANREVT